MLDLSNLMYTASSTVSGNGTFLVSGISKYKALDRSNKPDVIKHGSKTLPDSPEKQIADIYCKFVVFIIFVSEYWDFICCGGYLHTKNLHF